ncbi:MAG: 4Fe-4S binding protein [Bacteroidales bacterium]|nr:4Fe-4S binding protein [Bacteroidales bacterium]
MKGFIFDINKCVACDACIVACSVENDLAPPVERRKIYSFNEFNHPDLAAFNLSLACNHCEEASCMEACPAGAYKRDENTGAILLDKSFCIGCSYCIWACPYDAPELNLETGIIDKCTLCNEKVTNGGKPACAQNCPTGALDWNDFIDKRMEVDQAGFPFSDNKPAIRFIPKKNGDKPEIAPLPVSSGLSMFSKKDFPIPDSKISLNKEWPLIVFTLMVPLFVGLVSGMLTGLIYMKWWLYIVLAGGGLLLSTLHLGRKARAVYAIMNYRSSWLSREILSYGIFFLLSVAYVVLELEFIWIGFSAILFGLFCAFSMDKVYSIIQVKAMAYLNSSSVFLTSLMWISLAQQEPSPLFFIVFVKMALYLYRKVLIGIDNEYSLFVSTFRLTFLVIIPLILYFFTELSLWFLFFPLILGEGIDRMEFFSEGYIKSPTRSMYDLLLKQIFPNEKSKQS